MSIKMFFLAVEIEYSAFLSGQNTHAKNQNIC